MSDGMMLCLDFGTAWTKAAQVAAGSGALTPERLRLPRLGEDGGLILASAIKITPQAVFFGARALSVADSAPGHRAPLPFLSFKTALAAVDLERMLNAAAPPKYDQSGSFSHAQVLISYLAFVFHRLRIALELGPRDPLPAMRFTHPAWGFVSHRRLELLDGLFAQAAALEQQLPEDLAEGVARLDAMHAALARAKAQPIPVMHGAVLEAAAASAACALSLEAGPLILADIGAGTSDFGAFVITPAGELEEIGAARLTLDVAGDVIDHALLNLILERAKHVKGEAAQSALWRTLASDARNIKQTLFTQGKAAVRCGERVVQVSAGDLARQASFKDMVEALRTGYHRSLSAMQDVRGPCVVRVAMSGGGATLPFLPKLLKSRPSGSKLEIRLAPTRPAWVEDAAYRGQLAPVFPQLAVSIGGAAAPPGLVLRDHLALSGRMDRKPA